MDGSSICLLVTLSTTVRTRLLFSPPSVPDTRSTVAFLYLLSRKRSPSGISSYNKDQVRETRLTEIFGGAPGPRLALAQGEAALSAQEAPHPCPACGRARSSQPFLTPRLGGRRSQGVPLGHPRAAPPPDLTHLLPEASTHLHGC